MNNIIFANLKQFPDSAKKLETYINSFKKNVQQMKNVFVLFAVPTPFLPFVAKTGSKKILIGTQFVSSTEAPSSVVGESSAKQLKSVGASFALVNHQSKNDEYGTITSRINNCIKAGITPVLMIGEKQRDKEAKYLNDIKKQIKSILKDVSKKHIKDILYVYEPQWIADTDKDLLSLQNYNIVRMNILFIMKVLSSMSGAKPEEFSVLYAGNITDKNAENYLGIKEISGLGVGAYSRDIKKFAQIVKTWNIKR